MSQVKVGCPECGVLREVAESSLQSHNESKHDGERVARPVSEFDEEDIPELKSLPTNHRDSWKDEFEEFYTRGSVNVDLSKEEGDGAGPCQVCGEGRMRAMKGQGTDVLECDECGHKERDVHVM